MNNLEASSLVRRFGAKVAGASHGKPILDVACGSGRNAFFVSSFGATVICMDRELTRLRENLAQNESMSIIERADRLVPHQIDLITTPWPFGHESVGGIVNVHFTLPALFPFFANSLIPHGYLLRVRSQNAPSNWLSNGELSKVLQDRPDAVL